MQTGRALTFDTQLSSVIIALKQHLLYEIRVGIAPVGLDGVAQAHVRYRAVRFRKCLAYYDTCLVQNIRIINNWCMLFKCWSTNVFMVLKPFEFYVHIVKDFISIFIVL